jgi:hypothetical protein
MSKPLFTAFLSCDTFFQYFCGTFAANFPSVLEAVCNCLRRTVDTNGHSIDFRIDDPLRECFSGKTDEAQLQSVDDRPLRSAIDSDPNLTRARRKHAMPLQCRFKAHDTVGYSHAREDELMFEVRGKILASVEPTTDFDE